MVDVPYTNRELDVFFKAADARADEFHSRLMDRMDRWEENQKEVHTRFESKIDAIDEKVTYTNGKVKKIILALVLLAGITIGMNFPDWRDVIELVAGSGTLG